MPGSRGLRGGAVAGAALLLAACSANGAAPAPEAIASDALHPKVVELFQSQGCSSCPPANANLNRIADRPDILALSFAVTYWDRLGWKDRFAQPAFTARQWDYARAAGRQQVATPQMIWNGRQAIVGGNPAEVDRLVRTTPPLNGGPALAMTGGTITVGAGKPPSTPATVWLVRFDPRVQQVAISAGENDGRTLPHRNIVTQLVNLGRWSGKPLRLTAAPPTNPVWKTAILLQQGTGGPIIAARRF